MQKPLFLRMERVSKTSSDKQFGFFFGFLFLLISAFFLLQGKTTASFFAISIGLAFVIIAYVAPTRLATLSRLWNALGIFLGKLTNPLLLLFVFVFAIIPYALMLKVSKRDLLRLRESYSEPTYWEEREDFEQDYSWLKRQF